MERHVDAKIAKMVLNCGRGYAANLDIAVKCRHIESMQPQLQL
jgi:hypothetical protein